MPYDLLNPEPYSMATAEPYRPWSPYPEVFQGAPQMLLTLGSNALAGSYGVTNYGLFHQGNLYNNLRQQQYVANHNLALQTAGVGDTRTFMQAAQGAAAALNVQWTPQLQQNVQTAATNAASLGSGFLLQSEMGAQIASAAGWNRQVLTKYAHQAGRYMSDPMFPLSEYSAASAARTGELLEQEYFRRDSSGALDRRRNAGLGSYEIGGLLQEMTMRGQISPNYNFAGINAADGISGAERDTLVTRNFDQMKRGLDSRTKAIKALQEIFGDAGNPNAPIKQLVDSLEAFTGGTQQLSLKENPQRLEMIVRNLNNATRDAGLNLGATSALMGLTSQQLQQQGVNQAFTPQIVQEQLLMRAGLQRSGALATPAWGLMNVDQLSMLQNRRMQGAIQSDFGNFLGAAARLQARGGLDESTAEGRQVAQLLKEAQSGTIGAAGLALVNDENGRSRMLQMLQGAFGLAGGTAETEMQSRFANAEFVHRRNLGRAVTNAVQPAELGRMLGFTGGGVAYAMTYQDLSAEAQRRGVGTAGLDKTSQGLSRAAWDRLRSLDAATLADADRRNKAMALAMQGELKRGGGPLSGMSLPELERMAERQYNMADQLLQEQGGAPLVNFLMSNNPDAMRERDMAESSMKVSSYLQSETAGVLKDNPFVRMLDALIAGGYDPEKANLAEVFSKGLGVQNAKDQAALLQKPLEALHAAQQGLMKDLVSELGAENIRDEYGDLTPEAKDILKKRGGRLAEAAASFEKQINSNKAIREAFESANRDILKNQATADGAQDASLKLEGVTININGEPLLQDGKGEGKGTAKPATRRNEGGL